MLEPVLLGAHSALETVHSLTGTPWALTLPLSALLVRLTLVLPFTIYQRKLLRRQLSLAPLTLGWSHVIKKQTYMEVGHKGPEKATAIMNKNVKAKQNEILKRWGCQRWKTAAIPFAQLPIWLAMTETLRRMCGTSEGLFGMFIHRLEEFGLMRSDSPTSTTDSIVDDLISTAGPQTLVQEAGFANGGILWFPDLLVADPHIALPFILSATMLLNIFGKTRLNQQGPRSQWQVRLQRSLGVVALVVGPLTMHVPSGMLVYWISSASLGYLQAIVLDQVTPLPKGVHQLKPKAPLMGPDGMLNTSIPEKIKST